MVKSAWVKSLWAQAVSLLLQQCNARTVVSCLSTVYLISAAALCKETCPCGVEGEGLCVAMGRVSGVTWP